MTYLCICPTNSRSNSPDGRASTFSYNGIGQETGEGHEKGGMKRGMKRGHH